MIIKPNVDDLLEKVGGNRYQLVVIISKRAKQLKAGATSMIITDEKSVVTISAIEFSKDMYCSIDDTGVRNNR